MDIDYIINELDDCKGAYDLDGVEITEDDALQVQDFMEDGASFEEAINAVLSFLNKQGIIQYRCHEGFISQFIEGHSLMNVKSATAGIFIRHADVDSRVKKGDVIAEIMDPYTGETADRVIAPQNGIVFFHVNQPLIYSQTPLFRIIPTDDLV